LAKLVNSLSKVLNLWTFIVDKLIEDFEKWQIEEKKRQEAKELDELTRPCKIKLLEGYIFRQSNPAVIGTEVLEGQIKVGTQLMKAGTGKPITTVKSMQQEKDSVSEAEKGKQVAVAMPGVVVGRQINEGDILYSYIPEPDFRKIKDLKKEEKLNL